MDKPVIADTRPKPVELEAGETVWWCTCGKSNSQPFCDGSHKGSEFSPVAVEITEKKKYGLCGCKHTNNPPFCDGTHSSLED